MPVRIHAGLARIALLAGLLSLTACSPRAFNEAGQVWQRRACNQMEDAQRRLDCLASTVRSDQVSQFTRW